MHRVQHHYAGVAAAARVRITPARSTQVHGFLGLAEAVVLRLHAGQQVIPVGTVAVACVGSWRLDGFVRLLVRRLWRLDGFVRRPLANPL